MAANHYEKYYLNQIGGEIGPLYHSSFKFQKGRGLGGVLSSFWRFFKPLIQSGLKTVGREAVNAGVGVLTDIGTKPIKEILRSRIKEAGSNLKKKAEDKIKQMSGDGLKKILRKCKRKEIKRGVKRLSNHSTKRKRNKHSDIFSR